MATRKASEEEIIIIEGNHPAIVTKEEYEAAQAAIRLTKKPSEKKAREFVLKGKVRCGTCKLALAYNESGTQRVLYCPHKMMTGKYSKCCGELYSADAIEQKVWHQLKKKAEEEKTDGGNESAADLYALLLQGKITREVADRMIDTVFVYDAETVQVIYKTYS